MSEYIGMVHSPSYITFKQGIGNLEPLLFEAVVAPYYLVNLSNDGKWAMDISFKDGGPAFLSDNNSKLHA